MYDAWKDTAMASSPEIRASSHNIEVARQDYQRAISGHSPSLAGIASWNQQKGFTVSTINQNTNTTAIGLQLMIPIFSGGEVSARSSQTRANLEKAQAEYDATLNRVTLELRKQYDAVVSSNKKIMALNRAVESATELTKAMRKSVQGGQRINLDVLIADKGLATAQRDLARSKYEYLLAMLKLKQQAGVLTIEDLEKVAINFGAKSIEQYKLDSAIK
jgi:protease secretion system outer membrane protein